MARVFMLITMIAFVLLFCTTELYGQADHIILNPTQLSFSAVQGEELPVSLNFSISNGVSRTFNWYVSYDSASWLDVGPPDSGNTQYQVIPVAVNTTNLPVNTYYSTITVSSPTADNSPQTVSVTYYVSATDVGSIGCWSFDEGSGDTVHDHSGNNNHGTRYGADWVPGISGTALEFIDKDIVRYIPSSFDNSITTAFSIEAWVNFYGESPYAGYNLLFDARYGYGNYGGFTFRMNRLGYVILQIGDGTQFNIHYSAGTVRCSTWTHIAAVYDYDTGTVRFYINGMPDATVSIDYLYRHTEHSAAIGNNRWAPSDGKWRPFHGIADELCIYDRALSPDEILEHYHQQITPTNEWINVYCAHPQLNDVPLVVGNIITACDPSGVPCGIDTVREDGSFGFMPIYRDDPYSGVDEGAEPGDVITFKINGEEVFPEPPVVWTANGDAFEVCDFTTERCMEIYLHQGWNLISWNVAYGAAIDEIMAQLAKSTCVEVILGFDQGALTYDPDLVEFSTLLDVDYYHGYWFKMNCDETLEICGPPIGTDEGIQIYSGWNLVSYWPDNILSVEEGFDSILDNLLVALGYDYGGLTWLPGDSMFNTLTELKPLFGYWAKSSADDMLAYPGFNPVVTAPKDESGSQIAAAAVVPSRSWMSLYGSSITLDGVELAPNSLIDVYTHGGGLCGRGHYTDGLLKFTPVYGYDPMSEVTADYPKDGDPVTLYVNGTRVYPNVEWADHGSRVRIDRVFSTAAGTGLVPDRYALLQNYPNPFNPTTEIAFTLPVAGRVNLEIYNVLGQRVTTLAEGVLEAGEHVFEWDGTDAKGHAVSTGIYLYRLQAGDFVDTKKMVLMK